MPRKRSSPQKLLTAALKAARLAARNDILKSSEIDRKHRERLVKDGFVTEIIKGWNLLSTPEGSGSSAAWFGGFWAFLQYYLVDRFGPNGFCLSAEASLNLHAGDTAIPKQIVVWTKKGSNKPLNLLHDTSIFLSTNKYNFPKDIEKWNGINIMPLPAALSRIAPVYFRNIPENIEIILKSASLSVAEISRTLLQAGSIPAAQRIIGAYRYFGEPAKAKQIEDDLLAAGYELNDVEPFEEYVPLLGRARSESPYAGRIRSKWASWREIVQEVMPAAGLVDRHIWDQIIKDIQERHQEDAYHSLSIEGYKVSEELIAKIESGEWDPENAEADRSQKDVLAAKGYFDAFRAVFKSVVNVSKGASPGQAFENDLQDWYRSLFAPSVKASLMSTESLAGYRNQPVYISNSRHVPPPSHAVSDCMETLFSLLKEEPSPAVRAVLGHFFFVFIHPYMDGNGRIGRFLMNLMLASGGFSWTVIRVEKRDEYMFALERASVDADIGPFCEFIARQLVG